MIIPDITCMSKFALLIFGGMMPGGPGSLRGSHFRCNRHHQQRGRHDDGGHDDCDDEEDEYDYIGDELSLIMTNRMMMMKT